MTPAPKRRFEVTITVGGDTREDVAFLLRDLAETIRDGGSSSVTGGPSCGGILTVVEQPEMTHEKYHEQLSKHLDELHEAEAAAPSSPAKEET